MKKNKRGFTLVQILLLAGVMALAGIGVYIAYSNSQKTNAAGSEVQTSNAVLTEKKNLETIRAGVKNLFGGTQSYIGLSNIVLNTARITPDSMRLTLEANGDEAIKNSFGGAVTVLSQALGTGTSNGFRITYPKVPSAVCVKLLTDTGASWDQVSVGTTVVKAFGADKLSAPDLATACAANTGDGVTIAFDSL